MAKKKQLAPAPTEPKSQLQVEHWHPSKLKPYKRNAKNHPPEQIRMIAKLIEKHGFDVPIVVDGKGTIIKGHGRWLAAKELGMETVPVLVRADLTAAAAAEARIADNRVGEFGWDFEALVGDVVSNLKDGFDVELTGFTLKDLGLEADGTENGEGVAGDLWAPDFELEQSIEENGEPPDVVLKIVSKAKVAARVREVVELALKDAGIDDAKIQ